MNNDQKMWRMQCAKTSLRILIPIQLKKVITGDKTWVFECDSDQLSESPLEESSITTDQKSKVVKVQNQARVDSIF